LSKENSSYLRGVGEERFLHKGKELNKLTTVINGITIRTNDRWARVIDEGGIVYKV
jgi:hypothetical protein